MMGRGAEGGVGAHSSGMTQVQQGHSKMNNGMTNGSTTCRRRNGGGGGGGGGGVDIYAQAIKALALKSPFGGDEGGNLGAGGGGYIGPMVKMPSSADPKRKNRAGRKTHVVSKKRSFGDSEDGNPRLFWAQMEDYFREVGGEDVRLLFPRTGLGVLHAGRAQDPCLNIPPLGRRYFDVWAEEDRKFKVETPPGRSAAARGIKRKLLTASLVSKKKRTSAGASPADYITTVVSPAESTEEEEVCHVCNGCDTDGWNPIVVCDSCNVAVHHDCYGVHGGGDATWLCSWCSHRQSGADPEPGQYRCVLCPAKAGALKPVATDSSDTRRIQFAHLFCAQWVPETYLQDTLAMEPIRNIEGVREERWRLVCVICKEKHGACIQCSHGLCATPFHPLCARDAKLWMEVSSREDTEDLEVRAYCQKHSAERMGKSSLDSKDDLKKVGHGVFDSVAQNADSGSPECAQLPQNGRKPTELSKPELVSSLKKVAQLLGMSLETVASEAGVLHQSLLLWLEGKLQEDESKMRDRICVWLCSYYHHLTEQSKKNGYNELTARELPTSGTDFSENNIGQVKTNCQIETEEDFNDEADGFPVTRSAEREELSGMANAGRTCEDAAPRTRGEAGTLDNDSCLEPREDANECDVYVAPEILRRLQQPDATVSQTCSQEKSGIAVGGVDDQWIQLRQAKHLGIMDWFPQDEVEGEMFVLQNQLLDCASSNRCLSERLISKILCQLSKERQAARKQMLELSIVSQFLADAKEAKKQGRREKRDKEAQAVLAAATAAAAASPRTGYVKREGIQDDGHDLGHGNLHSPYVRTFRPPVPKPPRLNVSSSFRAQPIYKNSAMQVQEEQAPCDVCSSSDSIRSNRIIHCSRCNVSVHQDCYGVLRFPTNLWYCQPCSEFQQQQFQPVKLPEGTERMPPGVQCALCPNTSGAFKKSSDGRWVHVFCALWLPKSTFGKEQTAPIGGLDAVPPERLNLICSICQHQQGACIKCNLSHCLAAFHPICARDAGLYLNVRYINGRPQYRAYCERHSPQQRAKSADSISYAALKQHGTPDEIDALRQIRVEFERVRLICERICKRERIKRELTQCIKDVYITQLMAVTGGHSVEPVSSLQRPFDGNGALYSDALVEVPWTAESKLMSAGGESIWPVGRGSGVIVKELTSKRSVLPEPESVTVAKEQKKSRKYSRHSEPLGREKVMTPSEASMHNKLLPKGYAYVPVDLLEKGKQQEQEQQQQQQPSVDKKRQSE